MVAREVTSSPWEFACRWYSEREIASSIQRHLSPLYDGSNRMPRDVESPEFAAWLTDEYRHAMRKGIELAMSELQESLTPQPEDDPASDPEYQEFVDSQREHCRCGDQYSPCAGVLAGGPCDEMVDHDEDATPVCFICGGEQPGECDGDCYD